MMRKGAWSSFILTLTLLSGTVSAYENSLFDPRQNTFLYDSAPMNGWEFGIGGAYLYFKAREDGLIVGTLNDLGSPPFQGSTNVSGLPFTESGFTISEGVIEGKNLKLQPPYQSGFRLFAHVLAPCSDVEMTFSYSYYKTRASHTWNAASTANPFAPVLNIGTLIQKTIIYGPAGEFAPLPSSTMLSELNGHYSLKVQEYQLAFSYTLDYGTCFFFKPFIGLKGVLIDQALAFDNRLTIITRSSLETIFESMAQKSRFYSFGLSGGFSAEYAIGKGISAFGNLGLALVYGQQKLAGFANVATTGATPDIAGQFNLYHKPCVLRPCFDSGFGVKYTTPQLFNFIKGIIAISWEQHLYFKQNFFQSSIDFRNSENNNLSLGDLSTYGLVLSGELQF